MATVRKRQWIYKGEAKAAWFVDYFDQERQRRQKTFARKRDADAYLVNTLHEVSRGVHTADGASVTVAQAAQKWLDRCERDGLERSTIEQRRQHIDLHIHPFIGNVKLSRLTAPGVQEFVDRLLDNGRSKAMAQKVLTNLKALISDAQRRGLVAQNVARDVKFRGLSRHRGEIVVPSKEELRAMLLAVEGRWRPLIVTAIFTGMRASELRGLAWDYVDFDAKVIRVRQRADRWNVIGPPKSKAGRRDIPMAPMVLNALREWRLACPQGRLNLVFPNGAGNVESYAKFIHRGFGPLQEACGLLGERGKPRYTLHALRHAAASLFIEQAWTAKKVQAVMGHSSITMTFDQYGHLFPEPENDSAAMAQLEARLMG